jgi:hypothetical protein
MSLSGGPNLRVPLLTAHGVSDQLIDGKKTGTMPSLAVIMDLGFGDFVVIEVVAIVIGTAAAITAPDCPGGVSYCASSPIARIADTCCAHVNKYA